MIVVVGAGLSGLAAAHELRRRGKDVLVLEASDRVGGVVRSEREEGYLWEWAPNTVPASATEILRLAREVDLDGEIVHSREAAETRLVYFRGELLEVPTGPRALLTTRLFKWREKLRILAEPLVPRMRDADAPESVAHFVARRFGIAPARTLVDAFVSGIYAGDARRVGVRGAFPKLHEMEREHGSVLRALAKSGKENGPRPKGLISFRRGFGQLPETLARNLGDRLRLRSPVRELRLGEGGGYRLVVESGGVRETLDAESVVLAAEARNTGLLLAGIAPMASDLLFDIQSAAILCVHAGFRTKEIEKLPEAFGFLVPRPQRMRTLGWLFNSRIFEGRAPEGRHALTGYIGGATDKTAVNAADDALRHLVLGELSLALRMKKIPQPEVFRIVRHVPGIPQYDLGHVRRLNAVKMLLEEHPGLAIVGSFVSGVSLNDCVKTSREAVARLCAAPASGASA